MTAIPWTAIMPDETPLPAGSPALKWWETIWAPVLVIVLTGALGAILLLWQQAPAQGAQVASNAAEIAALRAEVAALQRGQISIEAEQRATREQMGQIKDTMTEIRTYHAATMKEVRDLGVAFAKIEGSMSSNKKDK